MQQECHMQRPWGRSGWKLPDRNQRMGGGGECKKGSSRGRRHRDPALPRPSAGIPAGTAGHPSSLAEP